MTATLPLLVLTMTPADASGPPDGPPPAAVRVEDAGELQGEWEVVGCVKAGADVSKSFKGEKMAFDGLTCRLRGNSPFSLESRTIRVDNYPSPPRAIMSRGALDFGPFIYRRFGDELLWEPEFSGNLWTLRRVKK